MEKLFKKNLPNQAASRVLADALVQDFLPKDTGFTLFLEGTLGVGKTFMAREILHALGVSDEISSPTYALCESYQAGSRSFHHFDFYRLESPTDFFARGFDETVGQDLSCHLVEWPERLDPLGKGCFITPLFILKLEFGVGVSMRKATLLQAS